MQDSLLATIIHHLTDQHYLDVGVEEPLEEALVRLPLHRPHGPAAGAVLTSHPTSLMTGQHKLQFIAEQILKKFPDKGSGKS